MAGSRHRRHHRDEQTLVEVDTSSGSPAVVVATVIGGAGVLVGFYALLRIGLDTADLSRPTATVFGITHTPLLALSEVGFGAVMILAAMTSWLGRVAIGLLSGTLAAFGAALLSAPRSAGLHRWFGVVNQQGWIFVVLGTIGLLATLAFPTSTLRTIVRPGWVAHTITNAPDADLASPPGAERGADAPDPSRPRVDLDAAGRWA
jgi:hypothetical protein